MTELEKELISDLNAKKISKEEFLRRFDSPIKNPADLILSLLEEAYRNKIPNDVEYALYLGFDFGFSLAHVDILCRLAEVDWHPAHENVVMALDDLKDKRAIEALYHSALKKHKYLDYDDSRALAVKAMWALGNLKDEAADEKLRLLTTDQDKVVRDAATHQLQRRQKN